MQRSEGTGSLERAEHTCFLDAIQGTELLRYRSIAKRTGSNCLSSLRLPSLKSNGLSSLMCLDWPPGLMCQSRPSKKARCQGRIIDALCY